MRKAVLCVLTIGFVALSGALLAEQPRSGNADTQASSAEGDQAQANGIKLTNNRSVILDGPPRTTETVEPPKGGKSAGSFRQGIKVTNNRSVILDGPPRGQETLEPPKGGKSAGAFRQGVKVTNNRSVILDGPPRRLLQEELGKRHALVIFLLDLGQVSEADRQAELLYRLAPGSAEAVSARQRVAEAR